MNGRGRLAVLVLVALGLAVLAWLAFGSREPAAPPVLAPSDAPPAAPIATPAASAPVAREAEAAPPPATQRELAPDAGAATLATMRGRCVDGSGAPLAGCRVRLHGWTAGDSRMSEWLRDHGEEPKWSAPTQVTTGSDGRFAFTFAPPPPFQFSLDLVGDGLGSLSGRWSKIAPGSTTDLGDIRMLPGVRITGRVVDQKEQPFAGEIISFMRAGTTPDGVVGPAEGAAAISGADGTFRVEQAALPGNYMVGTQKKPLRSPRLLQLVAERLHEEITVVLTEEDRSTMIAGRAVDASGAPAAGVRIRNRNSRIGLPTASANDGSFRIWANGDSTLTNAVLEVVGGPFDAADPAFEVAWGTSNVELRVVAGGALTIAVNDESGAPIEDYMVRLLPQNRGYNSGADTAARAQGHHDGGIAVIPGFSKGDWLLEVEFSTGSDLAMIRETIAHAGGPCRKDLRATRTRHRGLRVLGSNDAPIAGTRIKLCDPLGAPLTDQLLPTEHGLWLMNHSNAFMILQVFEGETAADGRLELRGPGDRDLALLVLGPGHVPLRQPNIRLDGSSELVVRVANGARLTGKIVPPDAVDELRRLAGGSFAADTRPLLQLRRDRTFFPPLFDNSRPANLAVADDGSFDAGHLPPGSWMVSIKAVTKVAATPARVSHDVTLVDGQTTTIEFDLAPIVPGRIDGFVTNNGAPVRDLDCTLQSDYPATVHTDGDGRFSASLVGGEYWLSARAAFPGGAWALYRCTTPVRVVRNQTATQTFAFTTATLRLTVLDAAGKPVAGVAVHARDATTPVVRFPLTDATGATQLMVDATTLSLRVLPKQLAASATASPGSFVASPPATQWIELQTTTPAAGQTTALELRLPAAAGY